MRIAIGNDHVGYSLKQVIVSLLESLGHTVRDFGADSAARVDYPIYGQRVAQAVSGGVCDLGVLICGTGIGISLAANKVPGIRAALCGDPYSAFMARAHNDANIVAFGSRVVGEGLAAEIVKAFLQTPFEGGRHLDRLRMLDAIGRGECLG